MMMKRSGERTGRASSSGFLKILKEFKRRE
jgi:hypothetical protein